MHARHGSLRLAGIATLIIAANGLFAQTTTKAIPTEKARVTPTQGLLTVFTDPPGAEVYLDGARIESSPFIVEVAAGEHRLRITSPGWEEEESLFDIQEDKKTVVTALMRKPLPTKMNPGDIGREHKEEVSVDDVTKEEMDLVFVKPQWPKTGKRASLLMMGLGTIVAFATVESGNFTENTNTATQLSIIGLGLGMVGTVIFYVLDENSGSWVEKPLPENIEYNKKIRKELEEYNGNVRRYNQETERLLQAELARRHMEIEKYNKGRGTSIEIY